QADTEAAHPDHPVLHQVVDKTRSTARFWRGKGSGLFLTGGCTVLMVCLRFRFYWRDWIGFDPWRRACWMGLRQAARRRLGCRARGYDRPFTQPVQLLLQPGEPGSQIAS